MICVYWPYKRVPEWFQKITATGPGASKVKVRHAGFGVIVNRDGEYHVYPLTSKCIFIEGPKGDEQWVDIHVAGGGKGVVFHC